MAQEVRKNATKTQPCSGPPPKTAVAYWMRRIKLPAGRPHYAVQIERRGRRQQFALGTAEKAAAANRAREIYLDVCGMGWEAALQKHRPETVKRAKVATVGELIECATRLSGARVESLDAYAKALRTLTASALGIELNGKKTPEAVAKWRAEVDAVPLDKLTPADVLGIKNSLLRAAKTAEERGSRAVTFNSLLRNSKALLSKKVRPFIEQELALPSPLWFEGVPLADEPSLAYRSKIDPARIIEAAKRELATEKPEQFKALLLCLVLGLRRSEADKLLWSDFDFANATLELSESGERRLKSKNSGGLIGLDAALVAVLRGFYATRKGKSRYVLETPRKSRVPVAEHKSRGYRADATFQGLLDWLRAQGVEGKRPIHILRKEVGSAIASSQGIFAAAKFLRHGDIRITHRIYADAKTPIVSGLGAWLETAAPENVTPADFSQPAEVKPKRRAAR